MKTLIKVLLLSLLSTALIAQIDSTTTEEPSIDSIETSETVEAVETIETEPMVESADSTESMEAADSLETPMEELVETDSTAIDMMVMDSTIIDSMDILTEDIISTPEPEMEWVQNDPKPAVIAALMNMGPLYFWSNDGLQGLGFESLSYVTIQDPAMIAIRANDCMDIVCHLLATDSSDVNYVVVVPEDSSDYKIYDTITKTVLIAAPGAEIVEAFNAFALEQAGSEYLAVASDTSKVEPVIAVDQGALALAEKRKKVRTIRNRQFRSVDAISDNPANLKRDFDNKVSLNLLPDVKVSVRNSLLTPGWYTDWWTTGDVWDAATKRDYLSTILNQDMALNVAPEFNLIGVRVGQFGVNVSARSHMKMVLPGNMLGLLMRDISLDETIENGGLEIEAIPLMSKATLSYGHTIPTPIGDVMLGVGLNTYKGIGYMRTVSDDFSALLTQDSVFVHARGEAWLTQGGLEGSADSIVTDDLDIMSTGSDINLGIDIGAIMDLHGYLNQEVEVQVALKNLGAKYTWSGLRHEAWTMDIAMPAPGSADTDSMEQYQMDSTIVLGNDETLTIDIPTVFNVLAIYQPLPWVIVGLGIEKAFTDEVRFGYSPDIELNYQLNLYATPWLDFSYYRDTQYGEAVHTFGSGFHFGLLETGLKVSFFNGLNTDAKGIGFGLHSSLHF